MLEVYKDIQPIGYKILKKLELNKHFAHAYLIETNGFDGGYDFALSLAKLILNSKNEETINQMINSNNYPELKIINSDGNWIKKEQLIDLQEEFNKKSVMGNNKVYIINGAEKLNIASSNTILKFLEEPEEGIIAILITNNIYQLLETIISRCQIISLNGQVSINKRITTLEKISDIFSNNNQEYEEFLNDKSQEKIDAVVKFVKYFEKNRKKILLHLNEYWFNYFNDKDSISKALLLIIYFYKDLLNIKIGCNVEVFNDYIEILEELKEINTVDLIIKKINIINENRNYLENNANLNLLMDRIIIEVEND